MGINGAHKLTHSLAKLKLNDLFIVARHRMNATNKERNVDIYEHRDRPVIDIDASWVARKNGKKNGGPAVAVMCNAVALAKCGFDVHIICDGDHRHHSKRVSAMRTRDRQKQKFSSFLLRGIIMEIRNKLTQCSVGCAEWRSMQKERTASQDELKKLEDKLEKHVDVGDAFYRQLQDIVPYEKDLFSGNIYVAKSEFQADTVIAYRCLNGLSDLVLATDTDLAALAGERCLAIKDDFKFVGKKNEDTNATLFSGYYSAVSEAAKVLGMQPAVSVEKAQFPVFDNFGPKVRALTAIGLGCDVYEGGIFNIGPSQIDKILDSLVPDRVSTKMQRPKPRKKKKDSTSADVEDNAIFDQLVEDNTIFDQLVEDNTIFDQLMSKLVTEHHKTACKKFPDSLHQPSIQSSTREMFDTFIQAFTCEPGRIVPDEDIDDVNVNKTAGKTRDDQAFTCEPGRIIPDEDIDDVDVNSTAVETRDDPPVDCCYMFETPTHLPKYLEQFKKDERIVVVDGPPMVKCQGPGTGVHPFLKEEGFIKCILCKEIICRHCKFLLEDADSQKKNYSCVECHASEMAMPLGDCESPKSSTEMLKELDDHGIRIRKDELYPDELQDIFEAFMDTNLYSKDEIEAILFPQESSNALSDGDKITHASRRFNMLEGARFLRDEALELGDVVALTELLAQMVTYEPDPVQDKKPHPVYTVMSSMMVRFAEGSRIHSGFRLLKRGIRHGMDSRTPHILTSNVTVIKYKGEVGLLVEHQVKASMIDKTYDAKVAFTKSGIVSVACNCRIGCCENQKVVCVHILPILFQLQMLLHDCLADHALYELASYWDHDYDDCLDDETKSRLSSAIQLLRQVARIQDDLTIYGQPLPGPMELLHSFTVGTKNFKPTPPPPSQKELGPIRKMNFRSPIYRAAQIIKGECSMTGAPPTGSEEGEGTVAVDKYTVDWDANEDIVRAIHKVIPVPKNKNGRASNEKTIAFELVSFRSSEKTSPPRTQDVRYLRGIMETANSNYRETLPCKPRLNETTATTTNAGEAINEIAEADVDESTEAPKVDDVRKCHVPGCNTCSMQYRGKFHNLPIIQKKLAPDASDNQRQTHSKKCAKRKLWLDRLGFDQMESRKKIKVCNWHQFEKEIRTFSYRRQADNVSVEFDATIVLPAKPIPAKTRNEVKQRQPVFDLNKNRGRKKGSKNARNVSEQKEHIGMKCHYHKCPNRLTRDLPFHRVPFPTAIVQVDPSDDARKRAAVNKFKRLECLRTLGLKSQDKRKHLRFCCNHPLEWVTKSVAWIDGNEKLRSTTVKYNMPKAHGAKSALNQRDVESRGFGQDRYLGRVLSAMNEKVGFGEEDVNPAHVELVQTWANVGDGKENISPIVARMAGIEQGEDTFDSSKQVKCVIANKGFKRKYSSMDEQRTVVKPKELTTWQVSRQTGFKSLQQLLAAIAVFSNGDLEMMETRSSALTWFEEWYFYFEMVWGRSLLRWSDAEDKYKKSVKSLRDVFDSKLKQVIRARNSWPLYASLEEDEKLRNSTRWAAYRGVRVIMWDTTNVHLAKMMDAASQRWTFNPYYSENCAKGGIGCQLCGWILTTEHWTGAVSDDDYFIREGVLERQQNFAQDEAESRQEGNIPFDNTLDKGYRAREAAWRHGKQTISQPAFAKSDKKFTGLQTLRSAAIASDRGANERAVRICKLSGFVKRGKHQTANVDRFADVWLAWSFQANFMFSKVL